MFLVLGSADLRLALGIAIFSESTAHGHFRSSHQTYSSNSPAAHFCPRNHKTPLTFFVKRGLRNHCMAPSIIRVNGSLAISGIGYQQGVVLSRICGGDVLFLPVASQPWGSTVTKGYNSERNGQEKVCRNYTLGRIRKRRKGGEKLHPVFHASTVVVWDGAWRSKLSG